MSRETHVWMCESLAVRFPRATRLYKRLSGYLFLCLGFNGLAVHFEAIISMNTFKEKHYGQSKGSIERFDSVALSVRLNDKR